MSKKRKLPRIRPKLSWSVVIGLAIVAALLSAWLFSFTSIFDQGTAASEPQCPAVGTRLPDGGGEVLESRLVVVDGEKICETKVGYHQAIPPPN